MLSKNSHDSFDERPEYKAKPSTLCRVFFVKIIERLLHGFGKLFPEFLRVELEELLIENMKHDYC